jgi:hypothetical protein
MTWTLCSIPDAMRSLERRNTVVRVASHIVRKIASRGGEADIPPLVPAENRLALDRNLSMPRREGFFDATPSREEAATCWIKRKDIPTPTSFLVLCPADWNRH